MDRHRLRQDVVMVHLELARVLVQVLEADLFLHEFVTLKAKAQFGDVAATRTTLVNKQFLRSRKHRLSEDGLVMHFLPLINPTFHEI